ncbi:MAG: LacI family DNA-binding transcriptional regulator [Anaerolineaceae bacterium]|nr:LacI family DNA-binding transcriptional regulator [Anaerolineaceae bacterium]
MVTIKEIAETVGVSIATVSRVLSNSSYPVSQDTRARILQVAQDLGYSPNLAARSLRTDQSTLIGVILDNFTSSWAPIIIRGLQDVFHRRGYFSLVVNMPWEIHSQSDVVQNLLGHSVDGFVFVETWHTVSERKDLLNTKPYVTVHRLFHEPDPYSVIPDDVYNSSLTIDHLTKLGHKRIAYIAGHEAYFSSEERLTGYKQSLEKAGLSFDESLIYRGNWSVPSGYQCTQELIQKSELPTAIAAANDQMAIGAILAVQEHGLRVPEDIAIVGYDNDEIAQISNPTLTTVQMPLFKMGQIAAENLLCQIDKKPCETTEQLIKGDLFVRQSCGDPQGKDIHASDFMREGNGAFVNRHTLKEDT